MKKIIILSAIIVFALNAKAQYPSTSEHIYFTGSKTDWVEVTEFTDGIVNDSIRGIVWGGKKFQRKDLNSTIFSAQSVGIRADGTDQTDLINKLLGKTYVSGLIMDVAGGGKITVNGNINAGGRTLYFNGSSYLGGDGGDTIKLGVIAAPETMQIFDTTIRIDSLSRTAYGRVSPMWWGAKGDNSTDDLIPLRISAQVRSSIWYLPRGYIFKLTDSLAIHYSNDVEQHSQLRFYTTAKRALTIGAFDYTPATHLGLASNRKYTGLDVVQDAISTWTDSINLNSLSGTIQSVGIQMVNLQGCQVEVRRVAGFTQALHFLGANAGFVHNKIDLGLILNAKYALQANRTGTGWYNSNEVNKGWISVNSGVNTSLARYGFILGYPGEDTYNHNNNEWNSPSFELNSATKGFPIVMNNAIGNVVTGARTEGNSGQTVVYSGDAERNIVIAGYSLAGTYKVDTSVLGTNVYIDSRDRTRIGADAYPVFKWSAINNSSSYSSTNVNVRGIGLFNSSGTPVSSVSTSAMGIFPNFIELRSANASIGISINTTITKEFLLKVDVADNKTGRILITLYDSYGNKLETSTYRPQLSPSTPSFTSSYGGGWIAGVNSAQDYMLGVPAQAVRTDIRIVRASDVVRVKSFSIGVNSPSEGDVAPILSDGLNKEYNLSTNAPIYSGTYNVGRIIYNVAPVEGSTQYWTCDTAGTARALTSASISVTSGNLYGIVSGVSLDSVYVNEYVSINSNTYRITRKNSDSLFFSSNAAGTYSGAFNYAQPTFTSSVSGSTGGTVNYSDIVGVPEMPLKNLGIGGYKIAAFISPDTIGVKEVYPGDGMTADSTDKRITFNRTSVSLSHTPTLSSTANISSSTPHPFIYYHDENNVFMDGIIEVTATSSTTTSFSFDLPVPADFTDSKDVRGTCLVVGSGSVVPVIASTSTDKAIIAFSGTASTSYQLQIHVAYSIVQP